MPAPIGADARYRRKNLSYTSLQIRTYGRDHFVVIVRLLETIAKVGGATDAPERLEPLRRQAQLAYEGSADTMVTDGDRQRLAERYRTTLEQLYPALAVGDREP